MIISVIGANGFIGLSLVKKIVDSDIQVRVLSRKKTYPIKGVEVFVADLTDINFNLEGFLDNTDILYNCSGEIHDESLMRKLHVNAVKRLIKLSKGKVGRLVQLGSVGSYGNYRNGVITENTEEKPVGVYEITKTESDNLVRESGIPYVILRPSNVFGLTMSNQSLFKLVNVVQKKIFFYIGSSGSLVNYVHVNDVVEALIQCGINDKALGNVFNISQITTTERMIESFQKGVGVKKTFFRLPEKFIRISSRILIFLYSSFPLTKSRIDALTGRCEYDSSKIVNALDFKFEMTLEERFFNFSFKSVL